MSNQRDDGFKGTSPEDDIFATEDDPMNEAFDAHRMKDIVDIDTDEVSSDISDYDDNEDGIFAPPPQKKKTNSSALLGTVAVVALIAAGGFALYKNPDIYSSLMEEGVESPVSSDVAVVETPAAENSVQPAPVATEPAPAPAPAPVVAEAVADGDIAPLAQMDSELAAVPQPQPIVNLPSATGGRADLPPANDTPVVPAVSPLVTQAQTSEMPAPPSPEETKAVAEVPAPVETTSEAAVATTEGTDAVVSADAKPVIQPAESVKSSPVKVNVKTTKLPAVDLTAVPAVKSGAAPQPDVGSLKPVPDVAMDDPVITADVKPLPKKKPETVYFDAPKGKAMESIPTPSLNAKRGKGESIIVVDNAITSTNQESGISAATRALRLARYDAALEMFNDLYRSNPRDARILMGRAVTLHKMGRSAEAIDAYEEVLNVDRDNPEAIVNLMGLIRKEYPARALEKLLQLKAGHPDNPGILAQLGIAYADSGNLDEAVRALMTAAKFEPNNPQHYFNLGVIAERMKNRTQAIAFYEKALETDAVYGNGRGIDRDVIYDRLTRLRS